MTLSSATPSSTPSEPTASTKAPGAFRTISEVADDLGLQQHVLRFWETKFPQIRPLKRGGGRRYYRPEDVSLLKSIHALLYTEKYTIKGVQKLLKERGKSGLITPAAPTASTSGPQKISSAQNNARRQNLLSVLQELKDLRQLVSQ